MYTFVPNYLYTDKRITMELYKFNMSKRNNKRTLVTFLGAFYFRIVDQDFYDYYGTYDKR